MAQCRSSGYAISELALARLLGSDGLMRLLLYVEENQIPTGEVVELIKRWHISGYEQVRLYLEEGISVGEV